MVDSIGRKIFPRCLHFCGVETVYQQSMRGHIIKSFMGFNGVIEIDKSVQGNLAMSAAGKHLFFMPHFHKGADVVV